MMGIIQRAIESGTKLEMIYVSNKNEITHRTVKIKSVGIDSFKAYCYLRKTQRTFMIQNVLSIAPVRKKNYKGAS
jgi:predicted DNA-binding transcriptional regulator YafY